MHFIYFKNIAVYEIMSFINFSESTYKYFSGGKYII